MPKTIYLEAEHCYFELGKNNFQAKFSVQFKFSILLFWLIFLLCLLVSAPNYFLLWRFSQTGVETIAIVSNCREELSGRDYLTRVEYSYWLDSNQYQASEMLGERGLCETYKIGTEQPVFFLRDEPSKSKIGEFLHDYEWELPKNLGIMSFYAFLIMLFGLGRHLEEVFRLRALEKAELILDACVLSVGIPLYSQKSIRFEYTFTSPKGTLIEGQSQLDNPLFLIEVGDVVKVLYLDDKNYQVL